MLSLLECPWVWPHCWPCPPRPAASQLSFLRSHTPRLLMCGQEHVRYESSSDINASKDHSIGLRNWKAGPASNFFLTPLWSEHEQIFFSAKRPSGEMSLNVRQVQSKKKYFTHMHQYLKQSFSIEVQDILQTNFKELKSIINFQQFLNFTLKSFFKLN